MTVSVKSWEKAISEDYGVISGLPKETGTVDMAVICNTLEDCVIGIIGVTKS